MSKISRGEADHAIGVMLGKYEDRTLSRQGLLQGIGFLIDALLEQCTDNPAAQATRRSVLRASKICTGERCQCECHWTTVERRGHVCRGAAI